jgi:hypothetical protein
MNGDKSGQKPGRAGDGLSATFTTGFKRDLIEARRRIIERKAQRRRTSRPK